jgi:hypothetical protein
MEINEAKEILQLKSDFNKDDIKKSYRYLVSKKHPDRFIDEKSKSIAHCEMVLLNSARDLLISLLSSNDGTTQSFHDENTNEDETFRHLWWLIKNLQSRRDYKTAYSLWIKSIDYLISSDYKHKYKDGILYDYISQKIKLLAKFGKYDHCFLLINFLYEKKLKSYYDNFPPDKVLFEFINKTRNLPHVNSMIDFKFIESLGKMKLYLRWSIINSMYLNERYDDIIELSKKDIINFEFFDFSYIGNSLVEIDFLKLRKNSKALRLYLENNDMDVEYYYQIRSSLYDIFKNSSLHVKRMNKECSTKKHAQHILRCLDKYKKYHIENMVLNITNYSLFNGLTGSDCKDDIYEITNTEKTKADKIFKTAIEKRFI